MRNRKQRQDIMSSCTSASEHFEPSAGSNVTQKGPTCAETLYLALVKQTSMTGQPHHMRKGRSHNEVILRNGAAAIEASPAIVRRVEELSIGYFVTPIPIVFNNAVICPIGS